MKHNTDMQRAHSISKHAATRAPPNSPAPSCHHTPVRKSVKPMPHATWWVCVFSSAVHCSDARGGGTAVRGGGGCQAVHTAS
jgi:hypothetical protein